MAASAGPDASELVRSLHQAAAQHPSLTARQLAAVLRGRKQPATGEDVAAVLEAHPELFESAGDPARWTARPQPEPDPDPSYTFAQLADAVAATADVVLRALRLWSDSEGTPTAAVASDIFQRLTNGGSVSLDDMALAELRRRVKDADAPPSPPPAPPPPPTPPAPPPLPPVSRGRWNRLPGEVLALQVTSPRTSGEKDLFAALCRMGNLLLVSNYAITGSNGREVETDAIVFTSQGVFTVEQKDTRGTGVLDVPVNGPPTLNGVALTKTANARAQARRQAQTLASQLRESPSLALGFITPVLCISGQVKMAAEASGEVLLATPQTIATRLRTAAKRPVVDAVAVAQALRRLRLPEVAAEDLARLGFATRRS